MDETGRPDLKKIKFGKVSTSGGTLLRDNRRLIGRLLIVLARQVQNNRD